MKKSIFLAALCLMNVVLMAQDYELRVLTFEDEDAQFSEYTLDYADDWAGRTITTWSDLIDDPQYGGPLTYADFMSAKYHWYDEGNTELAQTFPDNYAYCFWGGGHAICHTHTPMPPTPHTQPAHTHAGPFTPATHQIGRAHV